MQSIKTILLDNKYCFIAPFRDGYNDGFLPLISKLLVTPNIIGLNKFVDFGMYGIISRLDLLCWHFINNWQLVSAKPFNSSLNLETDSGTDGSAVGCGSTYLNSPNMISFTNTLRVSTYRKYRIMGNANQEI
jgi:hypothetical protein